MAALTNATFEVDYWFRDNPDATIILEDGYWAYSATTGNYVKIHGGTFRAMGNACRLTRHVNPHNGKPYWTVVNSSLRAIK